MWGDRKVLVLESGLGWLAPGKGLPLLEHYTPGQ